MAAPAVVTVQPGVLVDLARGVVHRMTPDGAVEAVEIASGKPLWSAPGAGKPLALVGRRLLVHGDAKDGLALAVLDVDGGGRRLGEATVALPEGVLPSIDVVPTGAFHTTVNVVGHVAWIRWAYQGQVVPRTPDSVSAPKGGTGAVRVDLEKVGEALDVRAVPLSETPPPPSPPMVPATDVVSGPWRSEGLVAAAVRAKAESAQTERYEVLRWKDPSGEPLTPLILAPGFVPRLVSADGRHLLASRHAPRADAAADPFRHAWEIVDLARGEVVHRGEHDAGAAPFVLTRERLVEIAQPRAVRRGDGFAREPLRVRVVDVATGDEVWSRPLRDVRPTAKAPPNR